MRSHLQVLRPRPRVAVLMVGSTEYHGEHLPPETDTLLATALGRAIARRYRLHLGPVIDVSCSHEHAGMPGTRSISETELSGQVTSAVEALEAQGFGRVLIVNAHGGNYVLRNVAQRLNEIGPRVAVFPTAEDWKDAEKQAHLSTVAHDDMHAGEREVSMMLHWHPDLVDSSRLPPDHLVPDRRHLQILGMRFYATSGYIGRPRQATAEKGARLEGAFVRLAGSTLALLRGEFPRVTTAGRARRPRLAPTAASTRGRGLL